MRLLIFAQALLLTTIVGGMAVSALVGQSLSPSPAWATLPIAAVVFGPVISSWPARALMARQGWRAGFMWGGLLGIAGAALSALAVAQNNFVLFCFGHLLIGCFQGFGNFHRFAAMESVAPEKRNNAMSFVIAAGVVAAFAGPALAHEMRFVARPEFVATYLAMAGVALVYLICVSRLRLPVQAAQTPQAAHSSLLWRPSFAQVKAVLTACVAYGAMVLAMTASPLAMVACGLRVEDTRGAIQWHVVAMFAPSFFTGMLVQRFGASRIAALGMLLLASHVWVAVSGLALTHFVSALVLLGLGWNFAFVGATSMLAQTYTPQQAKSVQAANELIVSIVAAIASLGSGWLLNQVGWQSLNLVLLIPIGVTLLVLLPAALRSPVH